MAKAITIVSGEECSLLNAYREAGEQRRPFIAHLVRTLNGRGLRGAAPFVPADTFRYRRIIREQLDANELELLKAFRRCSRRRRDMIVNNAEMYVGWSEGGWRVAEVVDLAAARDRRGGARPHA